MRYTLESIERMSEKLRALPTISKPQQTVSKLDAVKKLAGDLGGLQKRGFTLEQIIDSLRGVGLEISTPTLRNYLQRAKKQSRKRPKVKAGGGASAPPPAVSKEKPKPEGNRSEEGTTSKGGKDAFLAKDKDSY
ncbi:MAG: protein mobC [Myxococcales bacterium]